MLSPGNSEVKGGVSGLKMAAEPASVKPASVYMAVVRIAPALTPASKVMTLAPETSGIAGSKHRKASADFSDLVVFKFIARHRTEPEAADYVISSVLRFARYRFSGF